MIGTVEDRLVGCWVTGVSAAGAEASKNENTCYNLQNVLAGAYPHVVGRGFRSKQTTGSNHPGRTQAGSLFQTGMSVIDARDVATSIAPEAIDVGAVSILVADSNSCY